MLGREELRQYQDVLGFNLGQVEKDYLQHLLLLFLFEGSRGLLVFKGGTCLQKAFGLGRFSVDLDFTSRTEDDAEHVVASAAKNMSVFGFQSTLARTQVKSDSKTLYVKVLGPLYDGSERTASTLRVEVSLRNDILLNPLANEIVPVYSDLRPYTATLMDLSEILAEKVRALSWRSEAKDLYDLWFLLRRGVATDASLIQRKLDFYGTKFEGHRFLQRIRGLGSVWQSELSPLVRSVPDFEGVVEVVAEHLVRSGG
jgi:predicted nucleotidyltransferase component of viral defense system